MRGKSHVFYAPSALLRERISDIICNWFHTHDMGLAITIYIVCKAPLFESGTSDSSSCLVDKQQNAANNPTSGNSTRISLVSLSNQGTQHRARKTAIRRHKKPVESNSPLSRSITHTAAAALIMNNNSNNNSGNKALSAHSLKQQRTLPYARPTNTTNTSNTVRHSPLLQQATGSLNRQPLISQASKQAETVPVNDLVQLARSAFSQKNFTAALQFLTRALTVAPKDINLLDSRAASYEKVGQLDKALDDAKAMIRIFPQNPKVSDSSHDLCGILSLRTIEPLLFVGSYMLTERDCVFFCYQSLVGISSRRKDSEATTEHQGCYKTLCCWRRAMYQRIKRLRGKHLERHLRT